MPHYDYQCESCKYKFEVFQKITDEPIKKCPECGKKVQRIITGGVGTIFLGTGWTPKHGK